MYRRGVLHSISRVALAFIIACSIKGVIKVFIYVALTSKRDTQYNLSNLLGLAIELMAQYSSTQSKKDINQSGRRANLNNTPCSNKFNYVILTSITFRPSLTAWVLLLDRRELT